MISKSQEETEVSFRLEERWFLLTVFLRRAAFPGSSTTGRAPLKGVSLPNSHNTVRTIRRFDLS